MAKQRKQNTHTSRPVITTNYKDESDPDLYFIKCVIKQLDDHRIDWNVISQEMWNQGFEFKWPKECEQTFIAIFDEFIEYLSKKKLSQVLATTNWPTVQYLLSVNCNRLLSRLEMNGVTIKEKWNTVIKNKAEIFELWKDQMNKVLVETVIKQMNKHQFNWELIPELMQMKLFDLSPDHCRMTFIWLIERFIEGFPWEAFDTVKPISNATTKKSRKPKVPAIGFPLAFEYLMKTNWKLLTDNLDFYSIEVKPYLLEKLKKFTKKRK